MWKSMKTAPRGWGNYFLIRSKGTHPTRGGKYAPTVVQQIDGQFYGADDEITPLEFGENIESPIKFKGLKWCPIPE